MSGGGDRAALFHLGALRRLNELGVLSKIGTFTSVSGGSIIAAQLATWLTRAEREPGKPVAGFDEGVAAAHARLRRARHPHRRRPGTAPSAQLAHTRARSKALAAAYAQGAGPGEPRRSPGDAPLRLPRQ